MDHNEFTMRIISLLIPALLDWHTHSEGYSVAELKTQLENSIQAFLEQNNEYLKDAAALMNDAPEWAPYAINAIIRHSMSSRYKFDGTTTIKT